MQYSAPILTEYTIHTGKRRTQGIQCHKSQVCSTNRKGATVQCRRDRSIFNSPTVYVQMATVGEKGILERYVAVVVPFLTNLCCILFIKCDQLILPPPHPPPPPLSFPLFPANDRMRNCVNMYTSWSTI